jgi:hypothetical protein
LGQCRDEIFWSVKNSASIDTNIDMVYRFSNFTPLPIFSLMTS